MVELTKIEPASETVVPIKVKDILRQKGSDVLTAGPETSVPQALEILTTHSVGSLLVVDQERQIVGILSERDVLRSLAKDYDGTRKLRVGELMTRRVIIALETDSLESVMALFTERRIRHLPILSSKGELAGILSIGDVVKNKALHAESVVRYLTDFISGQYPA